MDILKKIGIHHWSMLFHYSTLHAINILLKKKLEIIFNTYNFFENNTKGHVNKILFNPFTLVPLINF
jgi:hypothetical protein